MKKILGFIAQKIGFSCNSSYSRAFIDGWFLGAGIMVKRWVLESQSFGKYSYRVGVVISSRCDFVFGLVITEYNARTAHVFMMWYVAIVLSHD